jgi:hypothetical protein
MRTTHRDYAMKRYLFISAILTLIVSASIATLRAADTTTAPQKTLFTQIGTDATFEALLAEGKLPAGTNTTTGVTGSKVLVNKELVEVIAEAKRPIIQSIKLHTLLHSALPRKDFPKWSRWYQEDGNTQIFRLFKGEMNRRNDRPLSARAETFSNANWKEADGQWHEWSGVITAIKPCGSILQVKSNIEGPAVMILMSENGTVTLNRRRGKDEIIAKDMIGKPFLLRVRDNGRDYEVFFNDKKAGDGSYDRPRGVTSFRWGMYVGEHPVNYDAMLFVSGATVDGKVAK